MPRHYPLWNRIWAHARRMGAGLRWASAPASSASRPTDATPSTEAAPPADDWRGGCGWFDSSHDLATGLSVQALELSAPEAGRVAPVLWLAWASSGPVRAAAPGDAPAL